MTTYVCVLRVPTLCLWWASTLVTTHCAKVTCPDSPPRHPSKENLVHPRVTIFYPQTTHAIPLPCITLVMLELLALAFGLSYPYRRCKTVLTHPIIILDMFTLMYMYDRPGVWGEFSQVNLEECRQFGGVPGDVYHRKTEHLTEIGQVGNFPKCVGEKYLHHPVTWSVWACLTKCWRWKLCPRIVPLRAYH